MFTCVSIYSDLTGAFVRPLFSPAIAHFLFADARTHICLWMDVYVYVYVYTLTPLVFVTVLDALL